MCVVVHAYTYTDLWFFQIAITGAASGIGLASAKLLAARGAILSLADINENALKSAIPSLAKHNEKGHIYNVVDVRDSSTVDSWIEATVRELGKLDGAVNMAGVITPAKPITETSDEEWDFSLAVNAKGVFTCLRAEMRAMSDGGSIVRGEPYHRQASLCKLMICS